MSITCGDDLICIKLLEEEEEKKPTPHRRNRDRRRCPECGNATMPTKNVNEERLSKFKNKGKDPAVSLMGSKFPLSLCSAEKFRNADALQKLRERRITVSLELRKAHKSENLLKRRNITLSSLPEEDALSPECNSKEPVSPKITLPSYFIWRLTTVCCFFVL